MRFLVLIPTLVILPFAAIALAKAITGDALSAVVLGLVTFVTMAAWFAAPSVSNSQALNWNQS